MAGNGEIKGKGQALRLSVQQALGGGPLHIFGAAAQAHDLSIREVSAAVLLQLDEKHPDLLFRQRTALRKDEIHAALQAVDQRLGQVIYVPSAGIKPDGAIIEVQDKNGNWRVVLVGESKHQGNDIENIQAGIKVGKKKDKDFMAAGNAIERVHKNIAEMRNFMIAERHFPYAVFLQGSNFAIESLELTAPDGRLVQLIHNAGNLNRIDRVTAASFGRPINQNYCQNIFVNAGGREQMLQCASLFFQAHPWASADMARIMLDIAETSLTVLAQDLE